jgi:hypothetical protein
MNKRLVNGLIMGAILGVFCIVGANVRFGGQLDTLYMFSYWLNRVAIGLVIGQLIKDYGLGYRLIRGLVAGLFVSFLFYSATDFLDTMGFFAGAIYGIIIESVLYKLKL